MNESIPAAPEAVDELIPDDTFLGTFAQKIYEDKYAWKDETGEPTEVWPDTAHRVASHVMAALGYDTDSDEFKRVFQLIYDRKFIPGGRYLYATGRELHQTNNCVLFRCEDSREGWSDLLHKCAMALQTGAGIGVVYSDVREEGAPIRKTGGVASGPLSPMQMVNEIGRHIVQGGTRRSAIWAGLQWDHPDIFKFIHIKDWSDEVRALKAKNFDFPAPMDMTNVSVILNTEFFFAYNEPGHPKHDLAHRVYRETVNQMITTAEPGFSIDRGEHEGENLRNACTEITSADDSDVCNLGSLNLSRIESVEELREVVKWSMLFLLAGSVYSDVPTDKIGQVREQNRRIGLGLMGYHEWLLAHGYKYGVPPEAHEWLTVYRDESDYWGDHWADTHDLARPKGKRGVAPNGSISYVGETTPGILSIIYVAYKRRFIEGRDAYQHTYVIDPTAKKIAEKYNVDPDTIEDSYVLSYDYERLIKTQAEIQQYVDHAISTTINLPYPITEAQEQESFANTLMKYLPDLRGFTAYPDGCRGGQPFTRVPYSVAKDKEGVIFEGDEETCVGGVCGV